MPVYAIVLDNGTELEIDADSPEIAQKQAVDYGKQSYADASKLDVTAEIGRSLGKGGEYAAEFLADTADVIRSPFDQFVPGFEDNQLLDELNPFGAEGPSDKFRREKMWESDLAQTLTAEKMRTGEHAGLDAAKTAAEYVIPAFTGQGLKKALAEAAITGGAAALGENIGARYGLGEEGELLAALAGGLGSGKVADAAVAAYRKIKP